MNPFSREMFPQFIALVCFDDKELVNMCRKGRFGLEGDVADTLEKLSVSLRVFCAPLVPNGKISELDVQYRRLEGIESRVHSFFLVVKLRLLSIVTKSSQLCRQFRIVRGDHASIAISAEIL
jgi:hypothetical protein